MSSSTSDDEDELDDSYGYCNACGEEMWEGSECCDEGEWMPADNGGGES